MRLPLVFLFAIQCFAQRSPQQLDSALAGLSRSFEQMVARVTPSVVQVIARGFGERSSGSGVIVDPSGYIVTNAHVVGLARNVRVLVPVPAEDQTRLTSVLKPTGKVMQAEVIGLDRETDIAVLKVNAQKLHVVPFADSEAVRQGQLVFALGSPFGLENSVTMGIVSSAARQVQADAPMIYVQTDAPINPGNSGGPLVDSAGALVGINTFIVSQSGANAGVGFAAPSNIVRNIYEQIRKTGTVKRGFTGLRTQTITPDLAAALGLKQDWGVVVADVEPRSSGEAAGVEIRDVLLTLNGKAVENARQFDVNIYARAGETVTLELLRGDAKVTKQVAVLERPPDREQMLSKVEGVLIPKLDILAVDLDEKVTPLLPTLRRLYGVVVAGYSSQAADVGGGLLPGDVIYAVNDTKISTVKELKSSLAAVKPGESVVMQIERAGQLRYTMVDVD